MEVKFKKWVVTHLQLWVKLLNQLLVLVRCRRILKTKCETHLSPLKSIQYLWRQDFSPSFFYILELIVYIFMKMSINICSFVLLHASDHYSPYLFYLVIFLYVLLSWNVGCSINVEGYYSEMAELHKKKRKKKKIEKLHKKSCIKARLFIGFIVYCYSMICFPFFFVC